MRSRAGQIALAGLLVGLLAVAAAGLFVGPAAGPDRATELGRRLRCPVCTSVSIAESGSPTAATMRRIVDEQIVAGRTDQQIIDFFRSRYGQWVLLDPPLSGNTLLVWLLPGAGVLVGLLAVAGLIRQARPGELPDLSAPDRDELERALRPVRAVIDETDEADRL